MQLKQTIDYTAFLRQVRLCQGQVYYQTLGGDRLNLKSMLAEYIFISAAMSSDLLQGGQVQCEQPADYALLADYTQEVC